MGRGVYKMPHFLYSDVSSCGGLESGEGEYVECEDRGGGAGMKVRHLYLHWRER